MDSSLFTGYLLFRYSNSFVTMFTLAISVSFGIYALFAKFESSCFAFSTVSAFPYENLKSAVFVADIAPDVVVSIGGFANGFNPVGCFPLVPTYSLALSRAMPVCLVKSRAFACHSPIFSRAFVLSNPAASSIAAFFL